MRSDGLAAFCAAFALVLFAPVTAQAFCRTTTVGVPPDFTPAATGEGCFDQGLPLYHPSQCLPYHLLAQESAVVPRAALSDALAKAFGAWTATNGTCSPGISGIELAPVNDSKIVSYQLNQRGHNVFGVVQGPWPHAGDADSLALATLTFDRQTGEIYDVDLEIRQDRPWSLAGTPTAEQYDLQAVLTHEVGHVLGFAHTPHKDAVMSPMYSVTQRTLSSDDQQAICAAYPDRQTRATSAGLTASTPCDLAPDPGGSSCGGPTITHGCSVGTTGRSRDGVFVAGLSLLAALAWQLRERRRVARTAPASKPARAPGACGPGSAESSREAS